MSIPPTIRAGSSRGRAYPTHANPWNRQAAKLSSSFRNGPEKVRSSTRSVQGAVPALNLRSSVDPGPCDSAELTGSRAGDRQNHLLVLRGFWSRPIERNVLAGLTIGLPLQPQSVHPMRRDREFESGLLQRRVHVSRDFALSRREAGFSRGCVGPAGAARSAETGMARCMAPTGGNISVGPDASTAASMRR